MSVLSTAVLVAVVPVLLKVAPEQATPSAIDTEVAKVVEARASLELYSEERAFVSGAPLARVRDCGSDVVCAAESLREIGAGLGLVVVVNGSVSPPLLDVRLLDAKSAKLAGSIAGPISDAEHSIAEAIRMRSAALFDRAGFAASARLIVRATPADAAVVLSVDHEEQPGSEAIFVVPAGVHRVRARLEGVATVERDVQVEAGRELTVEMTLGTPESLTSSPWFWAAGGAVVAAGVTTVLLLTLGGQQCFCVASPGVACDSCSSR